MHWRLVRIYDLMVVDVTLGDITSMTKFKTILFFDTTQQVTRIANNGRTKLFFTLISAEVGGWLGLILGASIISLIELIYFWSLLIRILIQKLSNCFIKYNQTRTIVIKS